MFEHETRRYRLTGLTPILGSQPASAAIRTQYIASRAPADRRAEEDELGPDLDEKGLTVFHRDPAHGDRLSIRSHGLRGFLKGAFAAGAADLKVANIKSKIDKYVFVEPHTLPLLRGDGSEIFDEDSVNERPLRAQTMQGERVAVVGSEQLDDPWTLEFEIVLITNDGTAKSKPITWDEIESALDYGRLSGLGQFRNGGYGRFTWERTDPKK